MGGMPPSHATLLEAWELHAQGYSYRWIGERLKISHETARQYAAQGAKLTRHSELLDPAEQRWRSAAALDEWAAELLEAKRAGTISILDAMTHMKWIHRERARLLGTDAPTVSRVSVRDDREPPTVDDDTIVAVAAREAQATTEARERAMLAGSDAPHDAPQY